ncbi:TolC family protein [Hyalangium minutum]|uniref:Heavy metal RND efflux outer membrane protein, CzcC family protein n=1 Tax=Hyalangium minutum TaxID=394096 RepID=A0A085W6F7_9BACT|nr:TolC family protein [Hyalangium minutum]KFE63270.1 Heavy metal RND efflux outer membrane protein, CzcC family protein [Hyalangium minutum]
MPSRPVLLLGFLATTALAEPQTAVPPPTQFQPKVEDPMLAPVPPASQQVERWEEALGLLKERNTDLGSAEANVDRAQGRWRQALSLLLPNARFSAGVAIDALHPDTPVLSSGAPISAGTGTGRQPTTPLGSGTVSLSQSVVDLSAWRGLSSAEASQRSAEASLQDVQRRLTLGLSRSLVAVVAAERAAELNRLGLRQALERAALVQRTLELGAATQLDLTRTRQDVEVARQSLIAGDEQLRRAREALGLSLGITEGVGVSPNFQLQGLVAQTQAGCAPLKSVDERPDLVAAHAQLESSRDSRRQASAGYLPTLGLTSNLLAYTTEPGPGRVSTWNIAAVLAVPIWEGGLRGGLVRERAGVERQAEATLERTRRDAQQEVARSRRGVEVAEALVKATAEARSLAEQTDQLTRRSFEIGRSTSLELVQSAAALRQAELALALREFELVQARLDAFLTEARCDW